MNTQTSTHCERVLRLLARLRHRQLDMALQGRPQDSAAYAHRARRVRRYSQRQMLHSV